MGQSATVNFKLEVKGGAKLEPKPQTVDVDAYMPLQATIKNDGNWYKLRIDAGPKEYVKFFVIDSEFYDSPSCPNEANALYVEFLGENEDKDKLATEAIKMNGPHIYMGPSLALLPSKIESIRFKNKLPQPTTISLMVGKTAVVPETPDLTQVGEPQEAAP